MLAVLRVAGGPRWAMLDGKHVDAAQFHPLTTRHGGGDLVEDALTLFATSR